MLAAARGSESGSGWSQVADFTLDQKHTWVRTWQLMFKLGQVVNLYQYINLKWLLSMVVELLAFYPTNSAG